MRDDQLKRIQSLQNKLISTVCMEADPDDWPGAGKKLDELTKDERGDRYWCKKNANATMSLLTKALSLTNYFGQTASSDQDEDGELDNEIANAEKRAEEQLKNYLDRTTH